MTDKEIKRPTSGSQNKSSKLKFSRQDIERADGEILLAFAILGLVSKENTLVCPVCGTSRNKKVEVKTSASSGRLYWTCHRCPETWGGSAIDLLEQHGGRTFVQAVNELLGIVKGTATAVLRPNISISDAFSAVVDVEIYDALCSYGNLEAAQQYYAQWHIDPIFVAEAGGTMLLDCDAIIKDLLVRFGLERLVQCGLVTQDKHGNPVFLFSNDYCVIEPHQAPSGHIVGLQFRPSVARMVAITAHKAWKARWSNIPDAKGSIQDPTDAWREAYTKDRSVGPKMPYVTPFLSLRGGTPDHLVGCGLKRLLEIPKGSTVYVVEGFKDLLAARTLGVEAYAIPGTGVMPPERSIELLRQHNVIAMLDGDAAGAKAREHLVSYLTDRGVACKPFENIREGLDVADILVERHAHALCQCPTCIQWVASHPYDPSTCPCKTCKKSRAK
jgi:5S rRNA maturation endonuclease (ribonuclease M5)